MWLSPFIVRARPCFQDGVFRVPKNGMLETNKPLAMRVVGNALASSKKPPCYNEYKVRQPNHYNKEESKWTIIVYHTQNGHANII